MAKKQKKDSKSSKKKKKSLISYEDLTTKRAQHAAGKLRWIFI